MADKLLKIDDLASKLGFCYEYTRRVVNQAYDGGCRSIIKVGKRIRIIDYDGFLNFLGEMKCQEKKNTQDLNKGEPSTTSKITSVDDCAVNQLKQYLN